MDKRSYLQSFKCYGSPCLNCNGTNQPYMLVNETWFQVFDKKDGIFCCIECFEKLIGRPLELNDFLEAPINEGFFGFDAKMYCALSSEKVISASSNISLKAS